MAAIDNPSETASGTAIHHVDAANTSNAHDAKNHVRMIAVLAYICGRSRGDCFVSRKYRSIRALTVLWNASGP
jgi:hypothetical protein